VDLFVEFVVNTAAGLVGVFAGVVLALWTERKREERQGVAEQATRAEELVHTRRVILSSVVKNTSEAKRLGAALDNDTDPYLFQASFELAVWEATQSQFMRLAALDERVLLSRFFDQVARLMHLMEFTRTLRVQLELRTASMDAGDRALVTQSAARLREVSDEVRLDGLVVVTDLGESLHKRLLGIREAAAEADAPGGAVAFLP
jgi:hypothetical protein